MPEIRLDTSGAVPRVLLCDGGQETSMPALWLRPRSFDASQRDAVTGQRLMNPHLLPQDLRLTGAAMQQGKLRLAFSDGFEGRFDPAELLGGVSLSEECPASTPWRADLNPLPWHDWPALNSEAALLRALHDFITLGFILVRGAPTEAKTILEIAAKFGHVRDTNFGPYFEVYTRPGSNDLAYRAVALGPHTDNPYRTPAPGIQILHCLQNDTSGGLSMLVDSLAVAEQLRREDPEGFELLASVPVRFEFRDEETHLVAVKPLIEMDGRGQMLGVFYSPKLDDVALMPEPQMLRYHRARRRLATLFEDPAYELRFRLHPGEFMMFDNNRVLHARTGFDPSEGHRQLQGCYIDRDGPRGKYLVLRRSANLT